MGCNTPDKGFEAENESMLSLDIGRNGETHYERIVSEIWCCA